MLTNSRDVGALRSAIRCLRNGIVPIEQIDRISVGLDACRDAVVECFNALRDQEASGQGLFVIGEWGTGKSHALAYIRSLCRTRRIPNASLTVNGRERALNNIQRGYSELIAGLEVDGRGGLESVLLGEVDGRTDGFREVCARLPEWDKLRGRTIYIGQQHKHVGRLGTALLMMAEYCSRGEDPLDHPLLWTVPLGGDLLAGGAKARDRALDRLEELGALFSAFGKQGLVVLFDEVETIDQLPSIVSRRGAYSALGRLIDMEYVIPVFAITKRFDAQIEQDRHRVFDTRGLKNYWCEYAADFLRRWSADDLVRVETEPFTSVSGVTVVENITEMYRGAYGSELEISTEALVRRWEARHSRNPRMLMRMAVDALDRVRHDPDGASSDLSTLRTPEDRAVAVSIADTVLADSAGLQANILAPIRLGSSAGFVHARRCASCGLEIRSQTVERVVELVMTDPTIQERVTVLASMVRRRNGDRSAHRSQHARRWTRQRQDEFSRGLAWFRAKGFTKVVVDGEILSLEDDFHVDPLGHQDISVVVDRLLIRSENNSLPYRPELRLAESIRLALSNTDDVVTIDSDDGAPHPFFIHRAKDDEAGVMLSTCVGCGMRLLQAEMEKLIADGFSKLRIDGTIVDARPFDSEWPFDEHFPHAEYEIAAVIDKQYLGPDTKSLVTEAIAMALEVSGDCVIVNTGLNEDRAFDDKGEEILSSWKVWNDDWDSYQPLSRAPEIGDDERDDNQETISTTSLEERLAEVLEDLRRETEQADADAEDEWDVRAEVRKAAAEGDADALFRLGEWGDTRSGVPRRVAEKSLVYYQRAAFEGHIVAAFNLGFMYWAGKVVKRDVDQASRWWQLAANQGHIDAQHWVSYVCAHHRLNESHHRLSFPTDVAGYTWYLIARALAVVKVPNDLDDATWRRLSASQIADVAATLTGRMNTAEIAHAHRDAQNWLRQYYSETESADPQEPEDEDHPF